MPVLLVFFKARLIFKLNIIKKVFDCAGKDIKIALAPESGLNLGDEVSIYCDNYLFSSDSNMSSSALPGAYNGLAVECRNEFDLAFSNARESL
jgi:hypothetical protein